MSDYSVKFILYYWQDIKKIYTHLSISIKIKKMKNIIKPLIIAWSLTLAGCSDSWQNKTSETNSQIKSTKSAVEKVVNITDNQPKSREFSGSRNDEIRTLNDKWVEEYDKVRNAYSQKHDTIINEWFALPNRDKKSEIEKNHKLDLLKKEKNHKLSLIFNNPEYIK